MIGCHSQPFEPIQPCIVATPLHTVSRVDSTVLPPAEYNMSQPQRYVSHHQSEIEQTSGISCQNVDYCSNQEQTTLPPFTVWRNKNGKFSLVRESDSRIYSAIEYIDTPSPMKDDLGASYGEHKWNDLYYFGALSEGLSNRY